MQSVPLIPSFPVKDLNGKEEETQVRGDFIGLFNQRHSKTIFFFLGIWTFEVAVVPNEAPFLRLPDSSKQ